jgi:hypothetical protein
LLYRFLIKMLFMTVLQYIAFNNLDQAAALCNNYGIEVNSEDDVVAGLYQIADQAGATGLKDILALHPDKEVIIENFGSSNKGGSCGSSCGGNCKACSLSNMLIKTNQATGQPAAAPVQTLPAPNNNLSAMLQTNTLLVVGIVSLITVAFLLHKNSN